MLFDIEKQNGRATLVDTTYFDETWSSAILRVPGLPPPKTKPTVRNLLCVQAGTEDVTRHQKDTKGTSEIWNLWSVASKAATR
jgi:hypothetical protein